MKTSVKKNDFSLFIWIYFIYLYYVPLGYWFINDQLEQIQLQKYLTFFSNDTTLKLIDEIIDEVALEVFLESDLPQTSSGVFSWWSFFFLMGGICLLAGILGYWFFKTDSVGLEPISLKHKEGTFYYDGQQETIYNSSSEVMYKKTSPSGIFRKLQIDEINSKLRRREGIYTSSEVLQFRTQLLEQNTEFTEKQIKLLEKNENLVPQFATYKSNIITYNDRMNRLKNFMQDIGTDRNIPVPDIRLHRLLGGTKETTLAYHQQIEQFNNGLTSNEKFYFDSFIDHVDDKYKILVDSERVLKQLEGGPELASYEYRKVYNTANIQRLNFLFNFDIMDYSLNPVPISNETSASDGDARYGQPSEKAVKFFSESSESVDD